MMTHHIRSAKLSDYDSLCRLFEEENRFHVQLVPAYVRATTDVLTREELQAFLESQTQHLVVCAGATDLIGVILISLQDQREDRWKPARRIGYIEELTVAADARGQGIGKLLMQAAREWVLSKGVQTIELHVWEANVPAQRFYERLGLRNVRRRMTWDLDSRPGTARASVS